MDPNTSGIRTWQWVVTAIVIIVLIVIGVLVFGGKGTQEPTGETGTSTPGTATALNRIVMSDQYPGNVVFISSVQFDQPGWVVIHKDNNGKPGAVIGSTYFPKGINPGRVNLSEPTIEGGVYYAMLHSDDGDEKFDASKDLPLKDSAGREIMKIFRASASVGAEIKG